MSNPRYAGIGTVRGHAAGSPMCCSERASLTGFSKSSSRWRRETHARSCDLDIPSPGSSGAISSIDEPSPMSSAPSPRRAAISSAWQPPMSHWAPKAS
eukprot:1641366-Prymnesium_polylepis.1